LERRDVYDRCKARAASLLGHGALPEEFAFCNNTSHALATVATSLPWREGDNCVVVDGDFPANVVVWRNLERTHGVSVRLVPSRPQVDVSPEEILAQVDERTRLVSVATCNYLSGRPFLLKPLYDELQARGVLLCADAIQTLGAIRLDCLPDFICADAHKWLLGPNGIALLWVRSAVLPQMHPMMLGWLATCAA
jgi:selenocysteine lyase/cysteine desulfurase